MTFNPAIPQPNDILSQSQAQIQTNFSQADTIFDVNHVTFDNSTVAERGKHRRVDFKRVAAPGSVATEAVVYQKLSNGNSQLFLQRDGVATQIQLTASVPIQASNGQTFLPGLDGFPTVIKWAQLTVTASPETFTYASLGLTDYVGFTRSVQLTPFNSTATAAHRVSTFDQFGFTIVATNGSAFLVLAIGN